MREFSLGLDWHVRSHIGLASPWRGETPWLVVDDRLGSDRLCRRDQAVGAGWYADNGWRMKYLLGSAVNHPTDCSGITQHHGLMLTLITMYHTADREYRRVPYPPMNGQGFDREAACVEMEKWQVCHRDLLRVFTYGFSYQCARERETITYTENWQNMTLLDTHEDCAHD